MVSWWSSSPQTESEETLDYVPIELHLYSRPVVISALLLPKCPDAPPHPSLTVVPHSRIYSPSHEFPPAKTTQPPPAQSLAFVPFSSLVDPLNPLVARGA